MKKITFILASMLLVLFASCKQSEESRIKSEFKQYVEENFDDPNKLEEIVSIELINTMTKDSLIKTFNKFKELHARLDTVCEKFSKELCIATIALTSSEFSYIEPKIKAFSDIHDYLKKKGADRIAEFEHNTYNVKPFVCKTYRVKYRINDEGYKTLKDIVAIVDDGEIKFAPNDKYKNYNSTISDFFEMLNEVMIKENDRIDAQRDLINSFPLR